MSWWSQHQQLLCKSDSLWQVLMELVKSSLPTHTFLGDLICALTFCISLMHQNCNREAGMARPAASVVSGVLGTRINLCWMNFVHDLLSSSTRLQRFVPSHTPGTVLVLLFLRCSSSIGDRTLMSCVFCTARYIKVCRFSAPYTGIISDHWRRYSSCTRAGQRVISCVTWVTARIETKQRGCYERYKLMYRSLDLYITCIGSVRISIIKSSQTVVHRFSIIWFEVLCVQALSLCQDRLQLLNVCL